MTRVLAVMTLLAAVLVSACGAESVKARVLIRTPIEVKAAPILLDPEDPRKRDIGTLRFVQGWHLTSPSPAFGGFSAIDVRGDQIVMLNDAGVWFNAVLSGDQSVFVDATLEPFARFAPETDDRDRFRDVEDMAFTPPFGYVISREDKHSVERVWQQGQLAEPIPALGPEFFRSLPENGGLEALTWDRDARLIMLAERGAPAGLARGWVMDYRRQPQEFFLQVPKDHAPTSAASLPNGDIIVTARRYSVVDGVSIAVLRFPARAAVAGARITPVELARITPPLNIDNIEGVAVTGGENGPRLWVVSDDNFSPLQRTLLMVFEILDPGS